MKSGLLPLHPNGNRILKHLMYWLVLVGFFTLVWGTYDNDYLRNLMVQLLSLPARMILVYVTLYLLFPKYFLKKKYSEFVAFFITLLVFVSIAVQRVIFFYIIQPHYLQNFRTSNFYAITEIMNTLLDVNLAVIVPLGYAFFKISQQANQNTIASEKEKNNDAEFIYLKVEKSLQKVYLNEIIFVESLRNYVKVKTTDREIIAYKSLSVVQELLPGEKFLRVHRSYIVGLSYIESISPSKLYLKGISIPVGRKYKEEVKNVLGYF